MTNKLPWRIPLAAMLGLGVAIASFSMISMRATGCKKPWIFFDLGNTLIAANPGQESRYLPGAHEYIREARRRGFSIGLITNIPEKWGRSHAEKIRTLKKFVAETWTKDPSADVMDWSDFPESVIVIPLHDTDRKPAPYPFQAAQALASREEGLNDCPMVFEGENPVEVEAAQKNGMKAYRAHKDPTARFLPFEQMDHL